MSQHQQIFLESKTNTSAQIHPHSSALDPALEARINRIMKNISAHKQQNVQDNPLQKHQTGVLTSKSVPSPERIHRGLTDAVYTQLSHSKPVDHISSRKITDTTGHLDAMQEGDTIIHKTVYQENLNKRVDDAILRTKKLVDEIAQSPDVKAQVPRDVSPGLNLDSISQKVQKAVQRTELNLKLSGEHSIPPYVSPSNQRNLQQYFSTTEKTKTQNILASPPAIESRLFASEQKALPTQFNFDYARKEYPQTAAKKPLLVTSKNIDEIFNQAMRRSQNVLQRNEELSKSSNSKTLTLDQSPRLPSEIESTVKISHFSLSKTVLLEDVESKLNAAKTEIVSSFLQKKEEPKFDISNFQLGSSKLLENKLSGRNFDVANHGIESKLTQSFGSPAKANKELHIFNNAVTNLSPGQKSKTVDENYQNGSAYKGEMLGRKKHGRGMFTYEDGSKYEGEWEDDLRCGYGTKTLSNGEVEYEGEWLNDKFHGNGDLNNPNPAEIKDETFDYQDFGNSRGGWTKYEGEFANGKWEGLGKLYLANGEKYIGRFKSGEIDGAGTFYQKNGETVTGEWKRNKFLGAL